MDSYRFRGFDAVSGRGWVYGDLVHNKKVTADGLEDRVMVGGYEVYPESVGLASGLKDANGREIFVGDILSIYDKDYDEASEKVVRFRHGVIGIENHSGYIIALAFLNAHEEYEIEVTGTVYESNQGNGL